MVVVQTLVRDAQLCKNLAMKDVRVTLSVGVVLAIFLAELPDEQYGYKLMQETGFKSGKIYQILGRLEAAGWLRRHPEGGKSEGPPRVTYTLVPEAVPLARRALAEANAVLNPTPRRKLALGPSAAPAGGVDNR